MEILTLPPLKEYELLDSGGGYKLERFGKYTLSRPDPNVVWTKKLSSEEWDKADAVFHREKTGADSPSASLGASHWENKNVKDPWTFSHGPVVMELHLSPFKHTGLFPEQILNWEWFGKLISRASQVSRDRKVLDQNGSAGFEKSNRPHVLNLFGYTGGATLWAAVNGAKVTHVDASKPSVEWAKKNQKLSGLENSPIRWIVDDAKKFVAREIKRGVRYDAVIMDPPSFGRDPKGKVFKFEKDVPDLLGAIKQVLVPNPLFALINSYSMGYSPTVIRNMLGEILPIEKISCGELHIKEKSSPRTLPCSIFARFES